MSKHLSDSWMIDSGFVDEQKKTAKVHAWWTSKRIADLDLKSPITITPDVSCREAIEVYTFTPFSYFDSCISIIDR